MRDLVFKRVDGSSVLVSIWDNGHVTMAEKLPGSPVWGPPYQPASDNRYGGDEVTSTQLLRELVDADIIDLDGWEEDMPEFVALIRKAVQG